MESGDMPERHSLRRLKACGGNRRLTTTIGRQHYLARLAAGPVSAAPVMATITANFGGFDNGHL